MSIKDFEILQELGKGAYGSVFKVRRIEDGEIYAMKKVILTKLNPKERENSINEIRILASINHPNIISYKDAFYDDGSSSICIIMEFADDGDLEIKITQKSKSRGSFNENEIWNTLLQITHGMKALHDKKILHRDLKSANVFLFKNGLVKIGDLNVSKINKKGLLYTQTGTPYYASPEVWKDKPYDHKSDIWSLGCVIYEMAALKPPFRGNSMEAVFNKVIRGIFDPIPHIFSGNLSSLISSLLQVNSAFRPNTDQIIQTIALKRKLNIEKINQSSDNLQLLQTIQIPKVLSDIKMRLPKPNYKRNKSEIKSENKSFSLPHTNKLNVTNNDINLTDQNEMINRVIEENMITENKEELNEKINQKNKGPSIVKQYYNIRDINYNSNPTYIENLKDYNQGKINNINNHIIIQNNINNLIKPQMDDLHKVNNIPIKNDMNNIIPVTYKPLIHYEPPVQNNHQNNINRPNCSPPKINEKNLYRAISANRQYYDINLRNQNNSALLEKNLLQKKILLPKLDINAKMKKDNSVILQPNPTHLITDNDVHNDLSFLGIENNKYCNPVNNRIYSSKIVKNQRNVNENSINALNSYIPQNRSVLNIVNVQPIFSKINNNMNNPPSKNNKKIIIDYSGKDKNENQNKLEILAKKTPVFIPKISVNNPRKVSPNLNANIFQPPKDWKI